MAWVTELEGSECQTMFISHVYATESVRASNELLVNYGQSFCKQLVTLMRGHDLTRKLITPTVTGEHLSFTIPKLVPTSVLVLRITRSGSLQNLTCALSVRMHRAVGTSMFAARPLSARM